MALIKNDIPTKEAAADNKIYWNINEQINKNGVNSELCETTSLFKAAYPIKKQQIHHDQVVSPGWNINSVVICLWQYGQVICLGSKLTNLICKGTDCLFDFSSLFLSPPDTSVECLRVACSVECGCCVWTSETSNVFGGGRDESKKV